MKAKSLFHVDSRLKLETPGLYYTDISLLSCLLMVSDLLVADLLLYPADVGAVDLIPCRNVLLHALDNARILAVGKGAAGLRDTLVEAAVIDSLDKLGSGTRSLDDCVCVWLYSRGTYLD